MRNAVIGSGVRSSKKKVFRDILLGLVGINFRICGILTHPGHPSDVFDVGYVPLERSLGAVAKVLVAIM